MAEGWASERVGGDVLAGDRWRFVREGLSPTADLCYSVFSEFSLDRAVSLEQNSQAFINFRFDF